ncbi:trans-2-enoyl-CoA reductase family protein [Hazenella sp. IB182357]|uniref:Trans-2-enoyl-CoA reductase [NADH] n=1 Tax=Polycladospora coralii TaxID=2771432 RepID=A0A926ND71_9BACL|nr:enoyl-ACP reductase FabV [Polycladospora coralii]MBD1371298.1 trans-2-enoyl-CoA reductase family protein [Polycladospora coralii]
MIIKPKFRGFICTTAHPEGCQAQVEEQIRYVLEQNKISGPKNVLIIGASTGYGLASRIVSTFGCGANTIGVSFERPSSGKRTATAGWYNTAAFEKNARQAGVKAYSINGDAFSDEIKQETIALIQAEMGQVDLVIYSLASPKRTHPHTGEQLNSVLKPIGQSYTNKNVDFHTGEIKSLTVEPATEEEIRQTIAVMGGEDWQMWIDALDQADVLAEGVTTLAYSYIGPALTHPIYREGTVGRAKDHLEETAQILQRKLEAKQGRAFVSINKALVTQSSAAIPVVPLYVSLLYRIMKEEGLHEGCIEQIYRLFAEEIFGGSLPHLDAKGRIRIDNLEMREHVQAEVDKRWDTVNDQNLIALSDIEGYRKEFFQLFGFEVAGIDYEQETNADVAIPSIDK